MIALNWKPARDGVRAATPGSEPNEAADLREPFDGSSERRDAADGERRASLRAFQMDSTSTEKEESEVEVIMGRAIVVRERVVDAQSESDNVKRHDWRRGHFLKFCLMTFIIEELTDTVV